MSLCDHLESDTEGNCALCGVYLCEYCGTEEATEWEEHGPFMRVCHWCASGDAGR